MKRFFYLLVIMLYCLQAYSQEETVTLIPKWRIGISGGLAYLTASSKTAERDLMDIGMSGSDAKDYYNGLKWGQVVSGDVHYLFKSTMGIGLKYHLFTSSTEKKNISLDINSDGINESVNIKEQLYYNFIGPSFYIQDWIGQSNKFQFSGQIAIGYLHYRDETRSTMNVLATGATVGINTELGVEYFINKHWALGLDLGAMAGVLNKVTLDDGEQSASIKLNDDARINMAHLNLSFGIRFYK